jgi:hypothetical protein
MALERGTNPRRSRRTCSPRRGRQSTGEGNRRASRKRNDSQLFHRCTPSGSVEPTRRRSCGGWAISRCLGRRRHRRFQDRGRVSRAGHPSQGEQLLAQHGDPRRGHGRALRTRAHAAARLAASGCRHAHRVGENLPRAGGDSVHARPVCAHDHPPRKPPLQGGGVWCEPRAFRVRVQNAAAFGGVCTVQCTACIDHTLFHDAVTSHSSPTVSV